MKINRLIYITIFFIILGILLSCSGKKENNKSQSSTEFSSSSAALGKVVKDLSSNKIIYYSPIEKNDTANKEQTIIEESDEPFKMVDFGPQEKLPSSIKKPSIYVVFSQPVVPLAKLGDPIQDNAALLKIEPQLKGIFRWYGSKLLSFEPETNSLPQQRYTVTVSDKIQSLGGKKLEGNKTFTFETERLSVLSWRLGDGKYYVNTWDVYPEEAKIINLMFSYPVNLKEISKWIEIRTKNKTWQFKISRPEKVDEQRFTIEQAVVVTLDNLLPMDTDVEIVVKEGARSEQDWLGMEKPAVFKFHTLLPFEFERVSVRSWSSPKTLQGDSIPIALEFSQPVDPLNREKYFSIDGISQIKEENVKVYGSTVVLNSLPLEYEHKYTVRISPDLKDVWGRTLGKEIITEAVVEEANSYVYIQNNGSKMLEASFTPKVVWETQNPVSLRRIIGKAPSLYEKTSFNSLTDIDIASIPKNSKYYFMEELLPYLGSGGKGTVSLGWEYQTKSLYRKGVIDKREAWLTVQVTDIGLTVRYAYNKLLVWATKLSSGEPVADAKIELFQDNSLVIDGKTDKDGLGVLEFPESFFASHFTNPDPYTIKGDIIGKGLKIKIIEKGGAASGGDEAEFIPNNTHNLWRFRVEAVQSPFTIEKEKAIIFLFTDRGLYKPGETVTFRGIDRNLKLGKYKAYEGPYHIEVSAGGYQAKPILIKEGTTTGNGGSYGSFVIPKSLDPGTYTMRYIRGKDSQTTTFMVANFERLRFQASVSFLDKPVYLGENVTADFSASYLSGGTLSGAPYKYYWTRQPITFYPNGNWKNWRIGPEVYENWYYLSEGKGILGSDGKTDIVQESPKSGIEGAPYQYRVEVSVQDPGRQEISARSLVTVHPASFYIASRIDSGTLKISDTLQSATPSSRILSSGKPATISWAMVSPEGDFYNKPASGWKSELQIELIYHEWKTARQKGVGGRVNLVWEKVEEIVENQKIDLSHIKDKLSGVFIFTPSKSGQWEVRLKSSDPNGRKVFTRFGFYVTGAGWIRWGSDDANSITLDADRNIYSPGDVAHILVRSPLPKGKYLLTLEREGIISEKIIELDGSARTIDIPIEESYIPIVYVALSSYSVRSDPPENTYYEPDLDKPKGIFGLTALYIDNTSRHYQVEIEPLQGVYKPAEEASVRLKVTQNGKPVPKAELSFMAVDRGVVDLINYHVPDPLAYFYNPLNFPLGVNGADSRSLLIDPVTYSLSDLQGGDAESDLKIEERKDFRPTAIFEPYLITGKDGTVVVNFKLPDSLTTYRCTAVAVGVEKFGIKEQDLMVSAPLVATAVLPKKLRWRDTGTVSLLLTNLEKENTEATVSLKIENNNDSDEIPLLVDGEESKTLQIDAGKSREVSFSVAAIGNGEAKLIFTLRSPKVNEKIIRTIEIDRPIVFETVTTIGNLADDKNFTEEGIIIPSNIPDGTGTLSVSVSASRLALLKEAVQYLLEYPYGCLEQRTAWLLPLVAFGEHLEAFGLESKVKNPKKVIEDELAQIAKNRLPDNSYPYWPGSTYGNYYVTLRVAHIAALAKAKGYKIPSEINIPAMLKYLTSSNYAKNYSGKDPFIEGYILWVRAMNGEKIGSEISNFLKRGDELGVSGFGFAGLAAVELNNKSLAISARDNIKRFIRPGTRTLDLSDIYIKGENIWGYDTDRYAIALMLFQALNPDDDMTSRLASALVEQQRRGVWSNTNSSYWAILAFSRVSDAEAGEKTDFISRVSLGGVSLFNAEFHSYGGVPVSLINNFSQPPLVTLKRDTLLPLRIEREGTGRLFYGASIRYGIPAELANARDEGLGVFTEIFNDKGESIKDNQLTAGETYTKRIIISSSKIRNFVALRVPVPSGAEILDASFVTTSAAPPKEKDKHIEEGRAAQYLEWEWDNKPVRFIMDDEVRFHWDRFPSGSKEVEFRFRAVMPGIYPTPPASAECMYESEVFGRGMGTLVFINSSGKE